MAGGTRRARSMAALVMFINAPSDAAARIQNEANVRMANIHGNNVFYLLKCRRAAGIEGVDAQFRQGIGTLPFSLGAPCL